jgi:hypothetical protein
VPGFPDRQLLKLFDENFWQEAFSCFAAMFFKLLKIAGLAGSWNVDWSSKK